MQSGVRALEPPKFVKAGEPPGAAVFRQVPIVEEPQSRLMEDMPDLVLGGHAANYDKQNPCVGPEHLQPTPNGFPFRMNSTGAMSCGAQIVLFRWTKLSIARRTGL